jgi:hypothetical protein
MEIRWNGLKIPAAFVSRRQSHANTFLSALSGLE